MYHEELILYVSVQIEVKRNLLKYKLGKIRGMDRKRNDVDVCFVLHADFDLIYFFIFREKFY